MVHDGGPFFVMARSRLAFVSRCTATGLIARMSSVESFCLSPAIVKPFETRSAGSPKSVQQSTPSAIAVLLAGKRGKGGAPIYNL